MLILSALGPVILFLFKFLKIDPEWMMFIKRKTEERREGRKEKEGKKENRQGGKEGRSLEHITHPSPSLRFLP